MQPSAEALSKLLLTLYAAPTQPELWGRFLTEFTQLVGLPAAAILHQDLARDKYGFGVAVGVDPAAQADYERYYGQMDAWRPEFLAKREGEVALGEALCATPDLVKTEFYGDYLSKYDVTLYAAVATLRQATRFELLSLYRGLNDAEPPPETLAAIELIVPHVRTALQLRHRLCEAEVTARNHVDVIEHLRSGVVLLNERGECLFANRKAEQVCAANEGLYLRHSRLGARKPDEHQVLCRLIDRATAVAKGKMLKACGSVSVQRPSAPPLKVSVMALSPQAPLIELVASKVAMVAVFIRSPDDEGSGLAELLIASYGLTSAEARLAAQLFDGRSLSQAAERNNVSRETVRGQLRSIFSKIQVRRQADLLRLCAELVREP
jgi:DNA-binding CsgD family transcriptional regulator